MQNFLPPLLRSANETTVFVKLFWYHFGTESCAHSPSQHLQNLSQTIVEYSLDQTEAGWAGFPSHLLTLRASGAVLKYWTDRNGRRETGRGQSRRHMRHNKHAMRPKKLDKIDDRATERHEIRYSQVASYEDGGETRNERRKLIWEKQVEQCKS